MHLERMKASKKLEQEFIDESTSLSSLDFGKNPSTMTLKQRLLKYVPSNTEDSNDKSANYYDGPFPLEYHNRPSILDDYDKDKDDLELQPTTCNRNQPDSTSQKKTTRTRKRTRNFNMDSNDPFLKAAEMSAAQALVNLAKTEKYQDFRKKMLEQLHSQDDDEPKSKYHRQSLTDTPKNEEKCEEANVRTEETEKSIISETSAADSDNASNSTLTTKDKEYMEKRKKNNEAARKSRAKRKMKEDEVLVRSAYLENENYELRLELAVLKYQMSLLRAETKK